MLGSSNSKERKTSPKREEKEKDFLSQLLVELTVFEIS
jgi:hypothetical protein